MKLVRLSPAASRLRVLNRLFAAGEISHAAYRRERRALIAEFAVAPGGGSLTWGPAPAPVPARPVGGL